MKTLQPSENPENEKMCMLCKATMPMWESHKCLAMLPRYEYKRTTDWEEVEKLGSEGWELVSTIEDKYYWATTNPEKMNVWSSSIAPNSKEIKNKQGYFHVAEQCIVYYLKREITE